MSMLPFGNVVRMLLVGRNRKFEVHNFATKNQLTLNANVTFRVCCALNPVQ